MMQINPETKGAIYRLVWDERNTKTQGNGDAAGNFLPYYYQRASIENRKYTRHLSIGKIPVQHGAIIHASQNRRHFFHFHRESVVRPTWTPRSLLMSRVALHLHRLCSYNYSITLWSRTRKYYGRSFHRPLTNLVVSSLRVLIMYCLSTSDIINCA